MSDSTLANIYFGIALGSLAGIAVDVPLYPRWWILVPLFVVLVMDMVWGFLETS